MLEITGLRPVDPENPVKVYCMEYAIEWSQNTTFLWEEFKEYIKKKYGKKHTVLGLEVENALREYLKKRKREEKRRGINN